MTYKQTREAFVRIMNENAYTHLCQLADIKNAIDAIDKQIPKKPTVTIHKYRQENTEELGEYKLTHCPYCFWEDKQLGYFDSLVDKGTKYCRRCGQALDWSDKE